jgi:hypothetical protein
MNPGGLNSELFFTANQPNTFMNMPSSSPTEGDRDILGSAIELWAEKSRQLGFEREADSVQEMAILVHKSGRVLASSSTRANQMCRSVICDGLSSHLLQDLSPLLISGCCYKLYGRLLCILQGLKQLDDKLKVSRVISFLDSDREFVKVIKAHQNLEDAHQTFSVLIPRLKQVHVTETVGEQLSPSNNTREKNKQSEIASMLYHYHPCGECKFQCIMDPL